MSPRHDSHSNRTDAGRAVPDSGLSPSTGELSELKALRRRERLKGFITRLRAPIASALAGAVLGGVVGHETDKAVEDSQTVYPYAIAAAALVPAGSIASSRRNLLISVVTMTFILGFLAGIAAGDSLNDVDQFSSSVRYGVAREEGT